jgi:5-formyltetrahydrofolate cyclo-ligase
MPGLAFDPAGHRIGYGGGFYDKYLSAQPGHPTVALCFDFQMLPALETEEFDIPVDLVLWA